MTTALIVERQLPSGYWFFDSNVSSMPDATKRIAQIFAYTDVMCVRVKRGAEIVLETTRPVRAAVARKVA